MLCYKARPPSLPSGVPGNLSQDSFSIVNTSSGGIIKKVEGFFLTGGGSSSGC